MKVLLKTISFCALAGVLSVAFAFFEDAVALDTAKRAFLWLAVVWFASVPFWMDHKTS